MRECADACLPRILEGRCWCVCACARACMHDGNWARQVMLAERWGREFSSPFPHFRPAAPRPPRPDPDPRLGRGRRAAVEVLIKFKRLGRLASVRGTRATGRGRRIASLTRTGCHVTGGLGIRLQVSRACSRHGWSLTRLEFDLSNWGGSHDDWPGPPAARARLPPATSERPPGRRLGA